jgi:plasmid stabilization system protein ParE
LGGSAGENGKEVAQLVVGFTLDALADIDQGFFYYAERAGPRVAARFLRLLDEAFERISAFPQGCPIYFGQTRRLLVRRFPYWVYYRVLPDVVEVFAVLHTKRDSSQIDWDAE